MDVRSNAAANVARDVMLFGRSPGNRAAKRPMPSILGNGFGQSIHVIVRALGFALDPESRMRHAMAIAAAPLESMAGLPLVFGRVDASLAGSLWTTSSEPPLRSRQRVRSSSFFFA